MTSRQVDMNLPPMVIDVSLNLQPYVVIIGASFRVIRLQHTIPRKRQTQGGYGENSRRQKTPHLLEMRKRHGD